MGANTDNQWTILGPGAKKGLNLLFPDRHPGHGNLHLSRLLRDLCALDGPKSGFRKLVLQFPAFLNKPFSLKNVEHALCEFGKYFRFAITAGTGESKNKNWDYSDDKSRMHLDEQVICDICQKPRMGVQFGGSVQVWPPPQSFYVCILRVKITESSAINQKNLSIL